MHVAVHLYPVRSISPLWPAPALQAVESVSKEILEQLGVGFKVRIETNWNPVPGGIKAAAGIVPSGGMFDGQIYLFADNIASDLDTCQTVFHELFHLGLSKTLLQGQSIQYRLKMLVDPTARKYLTR